MPTALVTGSAERAEAVADVLRAKGFSTRCSPYGLPLVAASMSIPDSSLACYVQVPDELHRVGEPADGELRASVVRDLLNRFDALGVVAPLLAPEAMTFVVPGHDADTVLFLILAGTVLGHHGAVSVTTVVTGEDALSAAVAELPHAPALGAADRASEDLVIGVLRGLEKHLWMLQAQVADPSAGAA